MHTNLHNYTTLPPVEFYAEFVVAHFKHSQFNDTTLILFQNLVYYLLRVLQVHTSTCCDTFKSNHVASLVILLAQKSL